MYKIREVTLKNGPKEKNVLVIDFDDPDMQIVGEFLMADAPLLHWQILREMEQVLAGEKQVATSSGNRCNLTIRPASTIISDLFVGMDDVDVYPSYEIDTEELRDLIVMWFQNSKRFNQR